MMGMDKVQALRIGTDIARVMNTTVYIVHDPALPDRLGWVVIDEEDLPEWEDVKKIVISPNGEVTEA